MTDESLPHVWVSFDLVALEREGISFDPDYVTEQLGVQPTQQNRVGDPIHDGKGRRTFTRWRVSVGPVDTFDISPMLSEVITHMSPADQKLRAVCDEIGVKPKLTCAIEPTSAQTPNVEFPPYVVRWAAGHDVAIAVDVMLWRDEDDGPNE